jgi:hypothetical protein
MTVAAINDPIATDAVENGGWLIHAPVQGKEADRRLHIGDSISKLLTMLSEVVVPMTKGKMGLGTRVKFLLISNDHVMVLQ